MELDFNGCFLRYCSNPCTFRKIFILEFSNACTLTSLKSELDSQNNFLRKNARRISRITVSLRDFVAQFPQDVRVISITASQERKLYVRHQQRMAAYNWLSPPTGRNGP